MFWEIFRSMVFCVWWLYNLIPCIVLGILGLLFLKTCYLFFRDVRKPNIKQPGPTEFCNCHTKSVKTM